MSPSNRIRSLLRLASPLAITLSPAACASGQGSFVAGLDLPSDPAGEEEAFAESEPLFGPDEIILAASGNVLLPRPEGLGSIAGTGVGPPPTAWAGRWPAWWPRLSAPGSTPA